MRGQMRSNAGEVKIEESERKSEQLSICRIMARATEATAPPRAAATGRCLSCPGSAEKKGNYADLELVRFPSSSTLAADGMILTLNGRKQQKVSSNEGTGLCARAIPGRRATFLLGHGSYMAREKEKRRKAKRRNFKNIAT